jgi:hypothetical protein
VPADFVPESFTAVSTSHWWVLGYVRCGSRDCPALEKTANGGTTLESLPAPGGPFGPTESKPPEATRISFANREDGWAFDPDLYATHNGGRTWTAIPMRGPIYELQPGSNEAFAVVQPPTPRCSRTGTCTDATPQPQLWRARPDSDDWTPDGAAHGASNGLAVYRRSVWVINSLSTRDGPALGTGLLHSADDGDHFAVEPQPIAGDSCFYSPASDTVVWSYCSGGNFMSAYRSTDAGTHFTAIGSLTAKTTPDGGYPDGSTLEGASPTTAVAANDLPDSPLIRTVDAGANWTVVQAPPNRTGSWSMIGFTTPDVGYALWENEQVTYATSTAQLWRTEDGGATWSPVTTIP